MEHELKTWPHFFEEIASGRKTFEIRENDRGFEEGDTLWLREYTDGEYTGRSIRVLVTYRTDFRQGGRYMVLGIQKIDPDLDARRRQLVVEAARAWPKSLNPLTLVATLDAFSLKFAEARAEVAELDVKTYRRVMEDLTSYNKRLTAQAEAAEQLYEAEKLKSAALQQSIDGCAQRVARQAVTIHEKTEAWRTEWLERRALIQGLQDLEKEMLEASAYPALKTVVKWAETVVALIKGTPANVCTVDECPLGGPCTDYSHYPSKRTCIASCERLKSERTPPP